MTINTIEKAIASNKLPFTEFLQHIYSLYPQSPEFMDLLKQLNNLSPIYLKKRKNLFSKILNLANTCNDESFRKNFYCFDGQNITFGDSFFINYCGLIANQYPVKFGNHSLNGPHVRFLACDEYATKNQGNAQIEIKDNVWIGAHSTICGGVSIGKNSVIGAYSVVTEDIPDNVIAFGTPCKVFRAITKEDRYAFGDFLKDDDIIALGEIVKERNYAKAKLKFGAWLGKKVNDQAIFNPMENEDPRAYLESEHIFCSGLSKTSKADIEQRNQLLYDFIGSAGVNNQYSNDFFIALFKNLHIGDNNQFGHNVVFLAEENVTLKNNIKVGNDCCFVCGIHPIDAFSRINGVNFSAPITIEDNVTLEDGVIVNAGVTIGKNSIIGRNSFVNKDIPENVYASGVPCKVIHKI